MFFFVFCLGGGVGGWVGGWWNLGGFFFVGAKFEFLTVSKSFFWSFARCVSYHFDSKMNLLLLPWHFVVWIICKVRYFRRHFCIACMPESESLPIYSVSNKLFNIWSLSLVMGFLCTGPSPHLGTSFLRPTSKLPHEQWKKTCLFSVYMGLYYPVIQGL